MPRGCAITLLIATSLVGMFLILASFAFLVINEIQVDLAALARQSRALRADDPFAAKGTVVSLTGEIRSEPLGDEFLAPGAYLSIKRIVEMYAWKEVQTGENSQGNPIYEDRKVWTSSPDRQTSNPDMRYRGATLLATTAQIDGIQIALSEADLPMADDLALQQELLQPGVKGVIKDDWLYLDQLTTNRPQIGNLRIRYEIVPSQQVVTVFGAFDNGAMVTYHSNDSQNMLKIIEGNRDAALKDLGAVQAIALWMIRIASAVGLWFGLLLVLYATRRLIPWPRMLRITNGSVQLATIFGLSTAVLAITSLWLSQGNLTIFAIAMLIEVVIAGGWLSLQRTQP